jgi:hypothetical protein
MVQPVGPADLRISDAERVVVQERLRRAVAEGRLDLGEFDERLTGVWAARTRRDLAVLTRDLPAEPPFDPAVPPYRVFTGDRAGTAMRVLATGWACALVVGALLWVLVSQRAGEFVYPWPVWLVPVGALLAVLYVAGVGRPALRRRTGPRGPARAGSAP